MSLYLQQVRGVSSLGTGVAFLPMMLIGAVLTPFSACIADRLGARMLIIGGLVLMTTGLVILAVCPASTPVWVLAVLMALVGLAGPLVMPPMTAVLLNSVPGHRVGTASGVFNTSRQVGGALAVAVFGALLANQATFLHGLRTSLLLAATVAIAAAASSLLVTPPRRTYELQGAAALAVGAIPRKRGGDYRRWERSVPMQEWQLDVMGSVLIKDPAAPGGVREAKLISGIDDHSRYSVIGTVVARATARAVCSVTMVANSPVALGRLAQPKCCLSGSVDTTASPNA
jgi:MFS family permease